MSKKEKFQKQLKQIKEIYDKDFLQTEEDIKDIVNLEFEEDYTVDEVRILLEIEDIQLQIAHLGIRY